MGMGILESAAPSTPRAEFQRSQIFGVLLYLCLHLLTQNDQIRHCNTGIEGLVLGSQSRPPSRGGVALTVPNFAGYPLLHRLT